MATWDTKVIRNQAGESLLVAQSYQGPCKTYVAQPLQQVYPAAPSLLAPLGPAVLRAAAVLGRDIETAGKIFQVVADNLTDSANYCDQANAENLAAIAAIWAELGAPQTTQQGFGIPSGPVRHQILELPERSITSQGGTPPERLHGQSAHVGGRLGSIQVERQPNGIG